MALGVAGTAATFTPVHRAVNQALESFSLEEAAGAEAPFLRLGNESIADPVFSAPSAEMLETLKPRPAAIAHVVKPGDTLNKLAEQYKVTPQTILWANKLQNADVLPIGHALLILPMSGVLHDVRVGDTITAIAGRYQIEPQVIVDANNLALDKQLIAGDQLIIPGGRPLEAPRPEPATRAVDRDTTEPRPGPGAPARVDAEPAPAPARPESSKVTPQRYEVKPGDTLVSIARNFGVSTGTIAVANRITGSAADSLMVGQELIVLPVDGVLHKVAEGDTVRDLSKFYGVDTVAVIRANALREPYVLLPGQDLVVPGGIVPEPEPIPAPAQPSAPPQPTPLAYSVAVGDSVVSIAERFGVDPRVIVRFNGLDRAELIAPGQNLLIPGATEPRAPAAGAAAPRSQPAAARTDPPAPAAPAPVARARSPIQAAAALVAPIVRPAAPPPPPPKPVVQSDNWGIVGAASKFLGYAYVWGGHSPRVGFDCTGFTWYVYQQVGRRIPMHDLWGQIQSGPRVSRQNLQAGDLVFFQNTYMRGLSHVGIYIGGNRFIHAGSERTGVTVSSLGDPYWGPRYFGASRPW